MTATPASPPAEPARYQRELDEAVAAARAAGRHLAEEFLRPGGPRGGGETCPADHEAEVLVRDRLLAAFPGYGFVAEEDRAADRPPADAGRHSWVVDPNDGTKYFLAGRRGASVSIGLLRDGEPVLGVVLAHTAPCGGEDLVTWAEGLGPVRRNGEPVTPALRQGLSSGDVVLVSPAADEHPLAIALALSPARFRPVVSIAYRLALVAAGEAAGAASLQPLDGHDVAGGHALLRGAGLALLGLDGREVRHQAAGRSRIGPVVAGAAPLARALAARLGGRHQASTGPRERGWLDLVTPRAGHPEPDAARLQRAQGALLGQLCGDALGSQVEFQGPEEIAEDYPDGVTEMADGGTWNTMAGQATDDSELALALARSLVRRGAFDPADVARAYAAWYETHPFDVGHTTRAALSAAAGAFRAGRDAAAAARGAARADSQANGALMRIAPLGIFGHARGVAEVMAWAREDARLTHPHPACQDASAVQAAAVALAVGRGGAPAALADEMLDLARGAGLHADVVAALERARSARPDYLSRLGHVTVALQNAFFQLRHASPEEGIVDTVRRGGDTDTNAAIAGSLLGAVHGVHALPPRWRAAVLSCFPVAGAPGVHRPRPPGCWAVDALVVAERLLQG